MTKVLLNSAKIKPRQHMLAVLLVTSLGIIRSEYRPKSDFSSLIRAHTICLYAKIGLNICKNIKQTTFSDAGFLGISRVKGCVKNKDSE